MNKLGLGVLTVAVLALTACGGHGGAQDSSKAGASAPAAEESAKDPAEAEWEASTPQNRETMCTISDGTSAESAAETMEFYGKQARPRTFDMSAKAHANRVALMKYAQAHCN
ncbi:hypothetical protein ACWGNY_15155 [[Kitasatospora] papulosa]|uniref:hypothetical protein n=1 Tax=[Kitasatospora] papulosa TaxID=1464011 RepID=UPI0036251A60